MKRRILMQELPTGLTREQYIARRDAALEMARASVKKERRKVVTAILREAARHYHFSALALSNEETAQ